MKIMFSLSILFSMPVLGLAMKDNPQSCYINTNTDEKHCTPQKKTVNQTLVEMTRCKHGLFLYPRYDNYVGKSLQNYGEWSENELQFFLSVIKPGDIVLDIGANIGSFVVPLARHVGSKGKVFSFEAQRGLSQMVMANVMINELKNVFVHNVALGGIEREIVVPRVDFSHSGNFGALSLLSNYTSGEKVPLKKLDQFIDAFDRCPTFIKIDIEGMELDSLIGGRELLGKCHPVLYIENNCVKGSKELIIFLTDRNYSLFWDVQPYYNAKNYFSNPINLFKGSLSINVIAVYQMSVAKEVLAKGYTPIRPKDHAFWSKQYLIRNPILKMWHQVTQSGNMEKCVR